MGRTTEEIEVYIDFVDGCTICICMQDRKGCGKKCHKETVVRDLYAGWEDTMVIDKYGRWKGDEDEYD